MHNNVRRHLHPLLIILAAGLLLCCLHDRCWRQKGRLHISEVPHIILGRMQAASAMLMQMSASVPEVMVEAAVSVAGRSALRAAEAICHKAVVGRNVEIVKGALGKALRQCVEGIELLCLPRVERRLVRAPLI